MHMLGCHDSLRFQRQSTVNPRATCFPVCGLQRTKCLRGSRPPTGRILVTCQSGEPQESLNGDGEGLGAQGPLEANASPDLTPQPAFNADQGQYNESNLSLQPISLASLLIGMAAETRDTQHSRSPSSTLSATYSPYSSDRNGWYECHLFDVLDNTHIDAQSASHFFSQLAVHDSLGIRLMMDDLMHTARIAHITGFTLPPIIQAQLQSLVQSSGPEPGKVTAEPLLSAYGYDLAALLDMLQAMDITPSVTWTDHAVRAWLSAAAASGQLSTANVRSAMTMLEAIYMPGATPSAEPLPLSQTPPYMAKAEHSPNGTAATWRPLTFPPSQLGAAHMVNPTSGSGAGRGGGAGVGINGSGGSAADSVQIWLDACLAALLDSGALGRAHQREDLYGMLPYLAMPPSAAIVERLYGEAWPPCIIPGDAAFPEHIASMLWLVAASGAKLPPAVIQGELRALEAAVLRIGTNGYGGGSGSRGGMKGPASGPRNDATTTAAVAALNTAFSLPPASGSSSLGAPPSSPTVSLPSSFAASNASSSGSVLIPPTSIPLPPFGGGSLSPPLPSRLNGGRRISPYGAYLALWGFHHHRYIPRATVARVVGPALLAAVLSAGMGGGRRLGPRQRCRVVRSILMCFGSVPPHLLARYDWSPLFRGWETLGAAELLPLLQDVATVARRQRGQRSSGLDGSSNGGGRSQLLRLSHLAAHIVQLPGWQRRLENVSLSDAIASLAGLLVVLSSDEADVGEDMDAIAKETEPDTTTAAALVHQLQGDDDGGGGIFDGAGGRNLEGGGADGYSSKAILTSPFAQGVLASWLGLVLPAIQEGVRKLTSDWGVAGRAAAGAGGGGTANPTAVAAATQRWPSYQQLHSSQTGHGPHGMDNNTTAGGARDATLARPSGYVAVAAAGAESKHGGSGADQRSMSWLPLPVAAETALAPTMMPQFTARELTAALTVLCDTVVALDPRGHPAFHRTLMWVMQRLGSRAGRCTLEPETFASVPDMLVRVDALGWVDVPVEWAHAVVQHPDDKASWFRNLPWHKALRTVLASGKLVMRARAEVLRQLGPTAAAATKLMSPQPQEHPHLQQPDGAGSSAWMLSPDGRPDAAEPPQPPSKAAVLLTAAQRLRNHLVDLLAARTASCSGPELRQLALTWQIYGMPYDQDALAVTLRGLAAALAAADGRSDVDAVGTEGTTTAVSRGSVLDAASRLEMMCEAYQVPREELERLFGPLRAYGL